MSLGIHTQQAAAAMAESPFFGLDAEEALQQEVDSTLPDSQGALKTGSNKHYTFTPYQDAPCAQKAREYVKFYGSKTAFKNSFSEKHSPLNPANPQYASKSSSKEQVFPSTHMHKSHEEKKDEGVRPSESSFKIVGKEPMKQTNFSSTSSTIDTKGHQEALSKPTKHDVHNERSHAHQRDRDGSYCPLPERHWVKEETHAWWKERYQQKERQGGQQGQDHEGNQQKEEKNFRVTKTASTSSKNSPQTAVAKESGQGKIKKPELAPPKISVFALYYILTKIGIFSDATSNFAYKKEIELLDGETTETHKKRLEDIKIAIKKEKECERWGVAVKVFSWIASLLSIIAGIALIATGVGAVAGAILIAGGTVQIASQIMEVAGGWKKIAEMLPGEDSEKKRAVITWMQIGIAVLCLILSGAGVIWGGVSHFGQAMQTAMAVIGGIASMGFGVTTIGEGISGFMYKDKLGDIKKFDISLAQLKARRQDLMEKVEWGVDRLEQLFEDLAHALEFEVELFQADQMLYRR